MQARRFACGRFVRPQSAVFAAIVSFATACAPPESGDPAESTDSPSLSGADAAAPQPRAAVLQTWRTAMAKLRVPDVGCFKASHPSTVWQAVECTTAPLRPMAPAAAPAPDVIGNSTDFVAQSATGISSAVGSFRSVSGVTRETDSGGVDNAYSLQLNTNRFTTTACSRASKPAACQGWQQFAYSNDPTNNRSYVFMQYWLLGYGSTCPSGWMSDKNTACFRNSPSAVGPLLPLSGLAQISLTGAAVSDGKDTVLFSANGSDITAVGQDSVLGLDGAWTEAEFNLFGACCGTQARFNTNATLVVATSITDGTTDKPACVHAGFTGETNNLVLAPTACSATGDDDPTIVFTERLNACSGGALLAHTVGSSCNSTCGRWACNGTNALSCQSFTNVCGGCASVPQVPGTGPQPGQSCTCSNGAHGRYTCSASKTLTCDCAP